MYSTKIEQIMLYKGKQAGAELGQAQPKLGLWLAQAETYGLDQAWSMVEPRLNCSGFGLN